MARSFRRTPISGLTNARSDKLFKRQTARRLRSAVRGALRTQRHETLAHASKIASRWDSRKDGKAWFGHLPPQRLRQMMRK